MSETPFFFEHHGYSLFGILHEPTGQEVRPPFVFCHPFVEEKLWTHRTFVTFARRLAAAGHQVLRFDYMGNGDSDGAFSASSLATITSDVHAAIAQVRARTGATTVNLLGIRLGATVASLVAEEDTGVGALVLWAPIVDGARYMQELLRTNLTTQMAAHKEVRHDREALVEIMRQGGTVNVDGYEMSFPLYSEVSAIKLASASKQHAGSCLVTQIDRAPGRPAAELEQLVQSYRAATLVPVQEEPFWKEIARFYDQAPNLFAATDAWLKEPA